MDGWLRPATENSLDGLGCLTLIGQTVDCFATLANSLPFFFPALLFLANQRLFQPYLFIYLFLP